MNLVITGASGFIGFNLVKYLKKYFNNVIAISRKNGPFVDKIVNDYKEIISYPRESTFLVHLADNNLNNNNSLNIEKSTIKVLSEHFREKLIFSSTAAVYKDSDKLLHEHNNINISNNYIENKLSCEKEILKNNGVVLRLSNVYGINMSKNNVFHDVLKQIKNEKIYLNNYNVIRDFIFVTDVCYLIKKIITNPVPGIYNVGTGKGTSIKYLTYEIIKSLGLKVSSYKYISKYKDKSTLILDVNNVSKVFGWEAKVSLKTGVKEFISYEKKNSYLHR